MTHVKIYHSYFVRRAIHEGRITRRMQRSSAVRTSRCRGKIAWFNVTVHAMRDRGAMLKGIFFLSRKIS